MYMYFLRLRSWFDLVDIGCSCAFISFWFYLVFNLMHVTQVFYVDLPQYLDLYVKNNDVYQREKKPVVVFSDYATVRDSHIDACPRMRTAHTLAGSECMYLSIYLTPSISFSLHLAQHLPSN